MVPSRQREPPHPCLSVLAMAPKGILGVGGGIDARLHPLVLMAGHIMSQTAVLRVAVPPAPLPAIYFLVFGEI